MFEREVRIVVLLAMAVPGYLNAQNSATSTTAPQTAAPPVVPAAVPAVGPPDLQQYTIPCASKMGERIVCAADTSSGVVITKSNGSQACLLGKTWGYDDTGIWVSDGCSGEFLSRRTAQSPAAPVSTRPLEYSPNRGFLLYSGEKGEIYFRLYTYVRYINQRSLDPSYVDSFGNTHTVQLRQDVQLQKFFAPFAGWFLSPKFRYYLYIWSANTSQGDPGAGRRRRESELCLQPVCDRWRRDYFASDHAEHRRPVAVLAGSRRPSQRRRILPGIVHQRISG